MSWAKDKRMIGGRTQYNKRRKMVREIRQHYILKLMCQGIFSTRDIRNWIEIHYPSLPHSMPTIQRDLITIRAKLADKKRCPTCGRTVPIYAGGVGGEAGIVARQE